MYVARCDKVFKEEVEVLQDKRELFFRGIFTKKYIKMHSIVKLVDTSDFEYGEIRPVTASAFDSVDPKRWDKRLKQTSPRAEDFGIDKDRKLYMYHGGDWISMETIERMDEHGNILFDKGAY